MLNVVIVDGSNSLSRRSWVEDRARSEVQRLRS
jgi:hypothetical protein